MASIVYTPSHDVNLPDNGPLFGAHTVVASAQVSNTGTGAGHVQMYISPRREEVGGGVDRQTVEPGQTVSLTASYNMPGSLGIAEMWAVVTDDEGNELAAHRFSSRISQREPQLEVQGHISISVG
jgi:hypothetical protein